jgi:hypothetical protein
VLFNRHERLHTTGQLPVRHAHTNPNLWIAQHFTLQCTPGRRDGMQPMPGGNLLIWSRLDPSVEEKRIEDDKATIAVCLWMSLGQDGDEERHLQNMTVRGAAIPGPC